jgi:hypothetical protein
VVETAVQGRNNPDVRQLVATEQLDELFVEEVLEVAGVTIWNNRTES